LPQIMQTRTRWPSS